MFQVSKQKELGSKSGEGRYIELNSATKSQQLQNQSIQLNQSSSESEIQSFGSQPAEFESSSPGFGSSVVSFSRNILEQHLTCLKHSILKFVGARIETLNLDELSEVSYEIDFLNQSENVEDYLSEGKSLIPDDQVSMILDYLEKDAEFQKTLEWIYANASPYIGDDLILAAHRILLAYLPVRHMFLSAEDIHLTATLPFNLANILNHPSFRVLVFSQQKEGSPRVKKFQQAARIFIQNFIETILLVLQKYFTNPQLQNIVNKQSKEGEIKGKTCFNKKKKITKKHL